ncbi:MAG: N-formylglutamate amidohydrolase [Rhodoferax sp.]|uniref:N-formylglutamate amidohydrolase n=1 Tax=Rhodoferax sp. TaxID=50421 RepID=UPI002613A2C6|nr:N-formylglutamate amidohydrolase [Rhodoferax sp.]MDD5335209.1 N-formylglutamate amidohydrolase [Rhodoferax sp.]
MQPENVFKIHRPTGLPAPLVLDSPHSGHQFPADFGAALSTERLRSAEDVLVNQLYAGAPAHGAHLLEACFPRSYIDPNRSAGDIDLELLDGPWPHLYEPSGKARLGKALVWRTLDDGEAIYASRLSVATVAHRITHYLHPYQEALKSLLDQAHAAHGVVYHINCHSMDPVGGAMAEGVTGRARADVVLGDRDGTTCEPGFTRCVADFFASRGYSVAINDPYKGVELVRRYSAPMQGRHSLQIELNKRLYLHSGSVEPSAGFPKLASDLDQLMARLVRYAGDR